MDSINNRPITFESHIKPIFAPYRERMLKVGIATPDGVFELDLGDYESVKALYERVRISINGHNPDSPSGHPMPPGRPLSKEQLDCYDLWLTDGLLEKAPVT